MKYILSFLLAGISIGCLAQTQLSVEQTFKQFVQADALAYQPTSTSFVQLSTKEETHGSPLLLTSWTTGKVTMNTNTVIAEPTTSLNFDKINKALLIKLSEKSMLTVNMTNVQSFILNDGANTLVFKKIPDHGVEFFQELYADSNYSLYKSMDTKFYVSDYVNKGLSESGYKYDRYVDEIKYYIVSNKGTVTEVKNTAKKDLKKLGETLIGQAYDGKSGATTDESMKNLAIFLNAKSKK